MTMEDKWLDDIRSKMAGFEDMVATAAQALADLIAPEELTADYIIPKAFDPRVGPAVAKAVAEAARKSGVARL